MAVDLTDYRANQSPAVTTIDKTAAGGDVLASGQANLSSSFSTFLTLLTAQLKNQDPTSPLDTNSFTQQLVQMTGVQQQLLSNQLLKQLVTQNANGDVKDALGLIGKTATADGTDAPLTATGATWGYTLSSAASTATLAVTDSTGRVMWTGPAPDMSKGQHSFTWDGKGTNAGTVGQTYKLTVTATNAAGATVPVQTQIQGVVNSVRQGDAGTVVDIGGTEVPLTAVKAVKA